MAPSRSVRAATAAVLFVCASTGAAGQSITESEAIRRFLEDSPQARRVPWTVRSIAAEHRAAALLPNPQVTYQIEEAAGVRDELLTLQQQLPLSGRRALLEAGAGTAARAARLQAERELLVDVFAVRGLFHEILYRERVIDRQRQAVDRLQRIVGIVDAREREGEGAGYDLLRAQRELTDLRLELVEAEAGLSVARSAFGAHFDLGTDMASASLEGELDPSAPPMLGQAVAAALDRRADLRALRAEAERLELTWRAARRLRFPEPVITAGTKRTESTGIDDTGLVASLAVHLPVFDRGRLATARLQADRERATLAVEILERRIRGEVQAALATELAALATARRYAEEGGRVVELRRIAELAYAEGEFGILELLDAYRTSLQVELRGLAAHYEARRAEIARERVIGSEVVP